MRRTSQWQTPTVYTSPDAAAQRHTTVLIKGGKIVAVGNGVSVPPGVQILPCRGCLVFAGFWNTHVHFTGPQWNDASNIPANKLTQQMQAMVTHSGFTTVVDTSSDRNNTVELRHKIETGDGLGPRIYTAGFGLYPPHGTPFYLDDLPASFLAKLPPTGLTSSSRCGGATEHCNGNRHRETFRRILRFTG